MGWVLEGPGACRMGGGETLYFACAADCLGTPLISRCFERAGLFSSESPQNRHLERSRPRLFAVYGLSGFAAGLRLSHKAARAFAQDDRSQRVMEGHNLAPVKQETGNREIGFLSVACSAPEGTPLPSPQTSSGLPGRRAPPVGPQPAAAGCGYWRPVQAFPACPFRLGFTVCQSFNSGMTPILITSLRRSQRPTGQRKDSPPITARSISSDK